MRSTSETIDTFITSRRGRLCYRPVRIALRVERTHVVDLLQVDVGEDQLVIGGVDDSWSVGAGKHV